MSLHHTERSQKGLKYQHKIMILLSCINSDTQQLRCLSHHTHSNITILNTFIQYTCITTITTESLLIILSFHLFTFLYFSLFCTNIIIKYISGLFVVPSLSVILGSPSLDSHFFPYLPVPFFSSLSDFPHIPLPMIFMMSFLPTSILFNFSSLLLKTSRITFYDLHLILISYHF